MLAGPSQTPSARLSTVQSEKEQDAEWRGRRAGFSEDTRAADEDGAGVEYNPDAVAQSPAEEHEVTEAASQPDGTVRSSQREHIRLLLQREQPQPADVEEHMKEAQVRMTVVSNLADTVASANEAKCKTRCRRFPSNSVAVAPPGEERSCQGRKGGKARARA